jgi:hypothetical protein
MTSFISFHDLVTHLHSQKKSKIGIVDYDHRFVNIASLTRSEILDSRIRFLLQVVDLIKPIGKSIAKRRTALIPLPTFAASLRVLNEFSSFNEETDIISSN